MSKCVDRTCLENVYGYRDHKEFIKHKDLLKPILTNIPKVKRRKMTRKKRDVSRLTKKQRVRVRGNKRRMVCGRRNDCYHCSVNCPVKPYKRNRNEKKVTT